MSIILVGLNHRTAPVELREKLALTGCSLQMALEDLRSNRQVVHEAVILSTCNRLEIYAVAHDLDAGWAHIDAFIAGLQNIPLEQVSPHLYHYQEADVIRHLMRVACGLDSMILGETQILGQVTQAFNDAQSSGLTGAVLSNLMSQSIHAGKLARTHTDISRYTTSVSHAGALMVMDNLTVPSPNILVVGAGEMAVLAAKALQKHEITRLAFINRTYSRAEALVNEIGGEALSWPQLGEALVWADAVIAATGAPHTIIYRGDVERQLAKREGRPLLFVDIAVPRDIEVEVGAIDTVQRYDIDDLKSIVDGNTAHRQAAVPQVEAIIEQETHTFTEWHRSREITPVIKDLRQWATDVAQTEVDQALNKLGETDERTAQIIQRLAHRVVNKILHEPTVRLRGQAAEGNGYGYAHAISELFGLDTIECDMRAEVCQDQDASCDLQCILPKS